jgi:hypothetical protein
MSQPIQVSAVARDRLVQHSWVGREGRVRQSSLDGSPCPPCCYYHDGACYCPPGYKRCGQALPELCCSVGGELCDCSSGTCTCVGL